MKYFWLKTGRLNQHHRITEVRNIHAEHSVPYSAPVIRGYFLDLVVLGTELYTRIENRIRDTFRYSRRVVVTILWKLLHFWHVHGKAIRGGNQSVCLCLVSSEFRPQSQFWPFWPWMHSSLNKNIFN